MGPPVTIGVDLGQKRDPTAIVVAERGANERGESDYTVRHMGRLPLRTPYPDVAEKVAVMVEAVRLRGPSSVGLIVDATGVGQPVADLLKRRLAGTCKVTAAYFTHGDRFTRHSSAEAAVGKAFLVSRLKALIQTRRIHLPRTSESDAMAQELLDYEIRVDENANDRYGAFKVGSHDDLVTALGLAVIEESRVPLAAWVNG